MLKEFEIILTDINGVDHKYTGIISRVSDMAAKVAIAEHKSNGGEVIKSWSSRPVRNIDPEYTYPEKVK